MTRPTWLTTWVAAYAGTRCRGATSAGTAALLAVEAIPARPAAAALTR